MSLKAGDKAPEFSLKDQQGKIQKSKDLKNKTLVLFFYPKDETPGCTAEVCSFRDRYDSFNRYNAVVWGVSGDSQTSHFRFSETNNLPFPILSDSNNKLRKAFGIQKTLGIIPGRVTYIINSNGIIEHVFNNLLNGPAHVDEALRILPKINKI